MAGRSCVFSCVFLCAFLCLGLFSVPVKAQLPDDPVPKVSVPEQDTRRVPHFDKAERSVIVGQSVAALYDGFTTHHVIQICPTCTERDPVSRVFIGRRPTWARMIPAGAGEVVTGYEIGYWMRKNRHSAIRKLWWVPQVSATAVHLIEGSKNFQVFGAASARLTPGQLGAHAMRRRSRGV